MKTNLSYYPHRTDSHRHPKFKLLRTMFANQTDGWAAEARFWALNNIIAESADCKLDLSIKRNQATVAEELGMNLSDFQNFITILKCEDVELIFEVAPGIFSTHKVQTALNITVDKRTKAKSRKKGSSLEFVETSEKFAELPENSEKFAELSQSSPELLDKVKESKVNKTKLNESKVKVNESVNVISPQPSSLNPQPPPLPFIFENFFPFTFDFTFTELVKVKISEMFLHICKTELTISETSRIFNLLNAESQISWQVRGKILFSLCSAFNSFPLKKRNLPYFCSKLKGQLTDQAIIAREKLAAALKQKENFETKIFLSENLESPHPVRDIINSLSNLKKVCV